MDGLDLLKKQWEKQKDFPKFSESDIYKMIHKKSSSIVKWIFLISVVEILLWVILSVVFSDESQKEMIQSYRLGLFMDIYSVIHWLVLVCFVFVFYRNFKRISSMSSAKILMSNILKARKVVKYYVWYNIIGMFVSIVVVTIGMIQYDKNITSILDKANSTGTQTGVWVGLVLTIVIMAVLMVGVLWLFYRIIYGILLKRLYKNYQELKRMEL